MNQEMRSPAPALASGKDRAEGNHNSNINIIAKPEPEADFAANYVARRFGLALPMAHAIVTLAGLGRFA
jgi:hypothetical protein